MTTPTPPESGNVPAATSTGASEEAKNALATREGRISVADSVVTKIAGLAAREISGVHAMGSGNARAFGAVRQRIPGSAGPAVTQGVSVEVGDTEAAIDLDLVVDYGVSITDLGRAIQRNVKASVERMTGLKVVEVNINVDDVYLGGNDEKDDGDAPGPNPRVQ